MRTQETLNHGNQYYGLADESETLRSGYSVGVILFSMANGTSFFFVCSLSVSLHHSVYCSHFLYFYFRFVTHEICSFPSSFIIYCSCFSVFLSNNNYANLFVFYQSDRVRLSPHGYRHCLPQSTSQDLTAESAISSPFIIRLRSVSSGEPKPTSSLTQ